MRWYEILARILLILSVIDFALAAPVVVQEHEVRVSVVGAANDGTATSLRRDPSNKWPANAADRTNAPPIPILRSSDSGKWLEQDSEPRQHNPKSRTDSNDSPELLNPAAPPIDLYANNPPSSNPPPGPGSTSPSPTNQAPTDEPDPSPHGNTDLNPSPYEGQGPTDNSDRPGPLHDNLYSSSFPQSSSLKFKSLSELMSTPMHDTPPPDGSPQRASSPDESYSSSSWVPTDSHSGSTSSESWSPQDRVSPPANSPGSSQDHVPSPPNLGDRLPSDSHSVSSGSTTEKTYPSTKFKSLSELMSAPTHDTLPSDGSPQIASSPDESYSSSSWAPTDSHSGQTKSWSSALSSTAEYYLGSPDQSSTDEYHPPTPGPTDNHPPPASSSNPGPSTEPNPPPSAKRPPPEEHEFGSFLSKIPKGKFKRRFSSSGAVHWMRHRGPGYLQGTFNSRAPATSAISGIIDDRPWCGHAFTRPPGPPPEPKEIGIA